MVVEFSTQGLELANWILYILNSTFSPFHLDYLGDEGLSSYFPGLALNLD
jgi:hypothetical protein